MSVKFLLFGFFFLGGGGECRFYFYGRADFSEFPTATNLIQIAESQNRQKQSTMLPARCVAQPLQ